MIRISLSSLALAVVLAGAATPAASETLKNNNQPTSCDCSNCSAEHCPGSTEGLLIVRAAVVPAGKDFTTQPSSVVDPQSPNVVYVGGSRR